MHENCNFVLRFNIPALIVHAPFSWAARHTTECLDTIIAC